jgi:hypothetical protein
MENNFLNSNRRRFWSFSALALASIGLGPLAKASASSSGAKEQSQGSLEDRIKQLEESFNAVKLQATRAQDALDVMCVQARYEAIHSTQESLAWMLYANRPDSVDEVTHSKIIGFEYIKMQFTDVQKLHELYKAGKLPAGTHIHMMAIPGMTATGTPGGAPGGSQGGPPSGGTPGAGAPGGGGAPAGGGVPLAGGGPGDFKHGTSPAVKLFGKGQATIPPIHPISSANVVVAGDGKTAKATFTSFGFERSGWSYGKYANSYIKVNGKWYLWHKKWLRGFSADYYKSPEDETIDEIFEWTKDRDANGFPVVAKELSTNYLWYPGKENMTITAPQPYDTWTDEDEENKWWKKPTVTP